VALADLIKDARLISASPDPDLRGLTRDFVLRRVRRLVELNPANADPARPGDITVAATPILANVIAGELPKVHAAGEEMWRRIAADPQQLPIDPATQRKRGTKRQLLGLKAARAQRRRLVRSIAYQAAAVDITLADPAGLDRLHRLCDRRLRTVERMVYDVGRVARRAWTRRQIESHTGGPWPDGYERLFEYPRVSESLFGRACKPDSSRRCTPPMQEWGSPRGDVHLHAGIRANPSAGAAWRRNVDALEFVPATGLNAVDAIQKLFEPSSDFLQRNLMNCDQTIHALHLEALVFAMTKRGRGTAWLDSEVAARDAGWLRMHFQFNNPTPLFLGGSGETLFFEHVSVPEADLQVGDHLIVYNHPAYANTTSGVWRLENAVVVQTYPRLLMQGHGSAVHDKPGMWRAMLKYFEDDLAQYRADVEGLAKVERFGTNTVTVNDTGHLTRGIHVDIVRDDLDEEVLAAGREIVSMSGRTIRYSGASVSSPLRHRLRLARGSAFDDGKEAITASMYRLVRRVPPGRSAYDRASQRADWFLTWKVKAEDDVIRPDGARAAFVKKQHLVEYTREQESGSAVTIGWFPLWQPSTEGGAPARRNGKIVSIEPVQVDPRQVAGWTWFFDPNPAKRDRVPVVRAREL
jgi:hypothetical protein